MKITLVTASFNDLVHGTSNNKKTGCGLNLMKPEFASRYHKSGEMTSLGELTCEKCKAKIAKELIKADSKEMKALLKEEKMRAKKGMGDDGLVQLSELEVKPTSLTPPEPEPIEPEPSVVPAESVQVNTNNPAYTNDLAQFAIKKPQPEPEPPVQEDNNDDFLTQFAVNKSQETLAPFQEEQEDDFLAQFSIQKPTEEINTSEEDDGDDFLAQFSVSASTHDTSYEEEPATPPVIDDISDALSAIQNNPLTSLYKEPKSENLNDDILSMFSIDKSQHTEEIDTETSSYINSSIIDDDESIFDSMTSDDEETESNSASEWDIIANQLFGGELSEEQPKPPVLDNISLPEIENIVPPVLDDISLPEIEDIVPPVLDDISLPEIEDITPPALDDISLPEIENIASPVSDDISLPEI
ncbi:MAG: hypothetical protein K2J47_01440, partial [Ruminococcus sp.]|nr:hypothetical protein [Ruminococcus sp.]